MFLIIFHNIYFFSLTIVVKTKKQKKKDLFQLNIQGEKIDKKKEEI